MQVWSNPQAVQDYKDLLTGKAPEEKSDGPSVIVGAGKLGNALAAMGMGDDVLVRRGESIPQAIPTGAGGGEPGFGETLSEFPIYVCVAERDVAGVIDACPPEKRPDLVFLQGRCIENVLKSRGLCRGDQTQATLFMEVASDGRARPQSFQREIGTDTRGEPKLSGESVACGKWRGALKERLAKRALPCSTVFYLDFRRVMFERLAFDCTMDLVGALHDFQKAGDVCSTMFANLLDHTQQTRRCAGICTFFSRGSSNPHLKVIIG
ncbi:unnamed protein product [Discosporangium mesarthrocarpum]